MGILIMKDYLAIARKADFVDLFKYGHFFIDHAVRFSGKFDEPAEADLLFENLTSKMNVYDYSFEYLIIHFVSEDEESQIDSIDIKNVKNIYAFDEMAKREMSISFDPRIQIHISPWEKKFSELHEKMLVEQSMLGIDNIWTIFGLPQEDIAKCKELIPDAIVRDSFQRFYSNVQVSGSLPLWSYLLGYERHSFYPKNMRGFFCDLIHVACSWTAQRTINEDVAETTEIYQHIITSADDKFQTLVEVMKESRLARITKDETSCEFVKVAPLYLFLKNKYMEGITQKPDDDFVNYTRSFGLEGSLALYLLGLTLGYDKTYEAFYEVANFSFLKRRETDSSDPQGSLFPDTPDEKEQPSTLQQPLMWVRNEKGDVHPIRNEEEKDLLSQGWDFVRRFTKPVMEGIKLWGYNPEQEKSRLKKQK